MPEMKNTTDFKRIRKTIPTEDWQSSNINQTDMPSMLIRENISTTLPDMLNQTLTAKMNKPTNIEYQLYCLRTFPPPFLIVLGTVANTLAILVLRKYIKTSTIFFYMMVLAIMNLLVLYIGHGFDWMGHLMDIHYLQMSDENQRKLAWLCKVYQFFFTIVFSSSHWIMFLMLADRCLLLHKPKLAKILCNVTVAKILMTYLHVTLVAVCIHSLWTHKLHALERYGCIYNYVRPFYYAAVFPWITTTLLSYLPMTLMTSLALTVCPKAKNEITTEALQEVENSASFKQSTGLMVVVIGAAAFVILSVPATAANIIYNTQPSWLKGHDGPVDLLAEYSNLLIYLRYVVCPVIYFACIPQLRQDLLFLLNKHYAKCHCVQYRPHCFCNPVDGNNPPPHV